MQQKKPTKQDIVDALQRIARKSADNRVSLPAFESDTGWTPYWFDKYWPESGYRGACEDAGVKPGLQIGVDTNTRITDQDAARRLADAILKNNLKFPPLSRLVTLTQTGRETFCRGERYPAAKKRLIRTYLELNCSEKDPSVEAVMRAELERLVGRLTPEAAAAEATPPLTHGSPPVVRNEFINTVRDFRGRGEEEQRQLVAQFFVETLGYRRTRVRSEHERNDVRVYVRVYDRRDRPWLVVEVKPSLENDRHRKAARRQGFDYAHRVGVRFVVLSDGDNYEVFDRCAGQLLSYDEMRQGNFRLTALRSRDHDLLKLLAIER